MKKNLHKKKAHLLCFIYIYKHFYYVIYLFRFCSHESSIFQFFFKSQNSSYECIKCLNYNM